MRTAITFFTFLVLASTAFSQDSPIRWQYSAQKKANNVYVVHITAVLEPGWHVYAQHQSKDAIAQPTAIKFSHNPLLQLQGGIDEKGEKQSYTIPGLDVTQFQYENKVDFIQEVKIKSNGDNVPKTNLAGQITFQVCTEERCLPPTTSNFTINL